MKLTSKQKKKIIEVIDMLKLVLIKYKINKLKDNICLE
jgi:hypothetical protein